MLRQANEDLHNGARAESARLRYATRPTATSDESGVVSPVRDAANVSGVCSS